MLGYVTAEGRGAADRLLAELADALHARGWPLAGVVQINRETRSDRHCDMDLCVLGHDHSLRISQDLGPLSKGCRLDPIGLENAVGLVDADLDRHPALLIINKFGKSEVEGRGFRAVIGKALTEGIPVLTSVNRNNLDGFLAYSADMAQPVSPSRDALLAWCEQTCAARLG